MHQEEALLPSSMQNKHLFPVPPRQGIFRYLQVFWPRIC